MVTNENEEFEFRARLEREQGGRSAGGYRVPRNVQKLAQMATTPVRGMRALGVAAQRSLAGVSPLSFLPGSSMSPSSAATVAKNIPFALERGAEAVQPGFVAAPGERIGATLGESAGVAGLTAPLTALTPARIGAQALTGAATGAGVSAIMDSSEEGRIRPSRTATNAVIGALLPILGSKGARDAAAKTAGAIARVQSGVDQRAGERLFRDPGAILSPSEKSAGMKLAAVRSEKGLDPLKKTTKEILDGEAALARKTAAIVDQKMAQGKATPKDLLRAKQAMDDIIEVTPMKQKQKRAELFELKNKFADALEEVAVGDKAAAKEYSRSALAAKFRRFLPVTKSGDISLTRTLFLPQFQGSLPAGIGSVVAGAAQSPMLAGLGVSAAGAATKVGQAIVNNPVTRTAAQSLVEQGVRNLTQGKAREYLRKAKRENPKLTIEEAREVARTMAEKDGWTIPE